MEEYHQIISELDELIQSIGKHFIPEMDSLSQYQLTKRQEAIMLLFLKKEHITLTEIASFFDISKSAVSQSVNKLEEEGLLIRTINPSNRREINLKLGANGEALKKELDELEKKMIENYLHKIPLEDLHLVKEVLKKLEAIVQEEKNKKRTKE